MAAVNAEPARAGRVEVDGPVVSAREIEIAATPEAVWEVLTGFARWPEWNADVKAMSAPSPVVAVGSEFRWKAGPGEVTSILIDVSPPRRIAWKGRTMGIEALHIWRIEPRGGRALVHTEESFRGLPARLFRRPLERMLGGALDRSLVCLAQEVERRATSTAAE